VTRDFVEMRCQELLRHIHLRITMVLPILIKGPLAVSPADLTCFFLRYPAAKRFFGRLSDELSEISISPKIPRDQALANDHSN